jgi:hypothetical protein
LQYEEKRGPPERMNSRRRASRLARAMARLILLSFRLRGALLALTRDARGFRIPGAALLLGSPSGLDLRNTPERPVNDAPFTTHARMARLSTYALWNGQEKNLAQNLGHA